MDVYARLCQHKALCRKLGGQDADDLFQESVLRLLETNPNTTNLHNYFKTIINSIANNKYSQFNKLRGRELITDLPPEMISTTTISIEDQIDRIDYWFDREILKLYIRKGTIHAVSNKTKISRTLIKQSLERCRQQFTA